RRSTAASPRRSAAPPPARSSSARRPDLEVLVGRRVREALDPVDARLLDPRPDAPEERQLVDGYVQHPVVHDLLDLVEQGLALLSIQLAGLPLEEVLDLRHHARCVDAVLAHVDLDARRRVPGGRAEAHDDALELVLAPRGE